MSFNRLTYDSCEYLHKLHEQTSPLSYTLDPSYHESTRKCLNDYPGFIGTMGGFGFGVGPHQIDIDSELRNQNRIASRCPHEKYVPQCNCPNCSAQNGSSCSNYANGLPCNCQNCKVQNSLGNNCQHMHVNQNLRPKGACNMKETNINRFNYLCENPQDASRVFFYPDKFRLGEETRMNAKASHITRCKGNTLPVYGPGYSACNYGGLGCQNY